MGIRASKKQLNMLYNLISAGAKDTLDIASKSVTVKEADEYMRENGELYRKIRHGKFKSQLT